MNRIAVIVIVTGIVRVRVIAIVRVMALPARCAVRRRKEKKQPPLYIAAEVVMHIAAKALYITTERFQNSGNP